MLKYTNVRLIDAYDFDELVRSVYNRHYCYQQQDGCKEEGIEYFDVPMEEEDYNNSTIPIEINGSEMGVSFTSWLNKDINEKFFEESWRDNLFWSRNFYPHFSMIINDLYKKGLIEKGSYVMSID